MILRKRLKQFCALLALCAIPLQGGIADTVTGRVLSNGEPVPYATVTVKGTTIGVAADKDGNYTVTGVPSGSRTVEVRAMGFSSMQKSVSVQDGQTASLDFNLASTAVRGTEIVVTGSRDEVPRKESPVIVSTVSAEELTEVTGSTTVAEGLNFATGLRMENDCQNCGFNQLRMNGLEGPYSQILIDGRAVFSAVAGVYGLELFPTNMIERIEVVRGAGSALYGSNAIGGTVNLILKDPLVNSYEFDASYGSIGVGEDGFGDAANDYTAKVNASVVSDDSKMGMTVFGFYRDREPFDANDDTFSEIAKLKNTTLGLRAFKRVGDRGRLTADLFTINEDRRGGDKFDQIEHEATIAESIQHEIINGALTYTQYFRDNDKLLMYVAAQNVDRGTYYGEGGQLDAYGETDNLSLQLGAQYKAVFGPSEVIVGVENNRETLEDRKLDAPGVPGFLITDQESDILGVFGQYQVTVGDLKLTAGLRWDNYEITNAADPDADIKDDILLPRASLLYSITDDLQARFSYGHGYRAPQVFNEDLHIETSGSKRVIFENAPGLVAETSETYMVSLDFDTYQNGVDYGFLVEGFYTNLSDPFDPSPEFYIDDTYTTEFVDLNDDGFHDGDGVSEPKYVKQVRANAEGAVVQGVNLEAHLVPSSKFGMKAGFTIQSSEYDEPQSEFGTKKFYRTPETYGFMTVDWEPADKLGISFSGTYTGKMDVPYNEDEELRESDPFFDAGVRVRYTVPIDDAGLQFYGGVKNIFNSYQDDFDSGAGRDPGYVYGPMSPRTFYLGLKFGNLL